MDISNVIKVLAVAAMTRVGAVPWLVVGWVFVGIGVLSALTILADVLRGYRQHMAIMNWVWPVTGLYWGPLAVYFYIRQGGAIHTAGRKSTAWTWSR